MFSLQLSLVGSQKTLPGSYEGKQTEIGHGKSFKTSFKTGCLRTLLKLAKSLWSWSKSRLGLHAGPTCQAVNTDIENTENMKCTWSRRKVWKRRGGNQRPGADSQGRGEQKSWRDQFSCLYKKVLVCPNTGKDPPSSTSCCRAGSKRLFGHVAVCWLRVSLHLEKSQHHQLLLEEEKTALKNFKSAGFFKASPGAQKHI